MSLSQEFRRFAHHTSPRVLLPLSATAVLARIKLGRFRWRDLGIAAAILGAEPFVEWLIHVFALHMKPKTVAGRTLDPLLARKHRLHHEDPRDEELIFIPLPVLYAALPAGAIAWLAGERNVRTAMTGIATSYAMLTIYEWTHFLIHSSYRPRRALYRRLWRAHRLHHYRNEHYWFGVTNNLGDRVLGTFPIRESVPRSDTARSLGISA